MSDTLIRRALPVERASLEALQWRPSLANSGDRDSLLANPDAIALPVEQAVTCSSRSTTALSSGLQRS